MEKTIWVYDWDEYHSYEEALAACEADISDEDIFDALTFLFSREEIVGLLRDSKRAIEAIEKAHKIALETKAYDFIISETYCSGCSNPCKDWLQGKIDDCEDCECYAK